MILKMFDKSDRNGTNISFLIFILYIGHLSAQQVDVIVPTYGPIAGGTNVILIGQNFSDVIDIILKTDIEDVIFDVKEMNDSHIYCTSPNVSEALLFESGPLTLIFDTGELNTTQNFTYLPNPVIESINPAKTTIDGGIIQTITGQHLDSVFLPELRMTLVQSRLPGGHPMYEQCENNGCYTNVSDYLAERCQVINSTMMTCRSKPFDSHPYNNLNELPPQHHETGINREDFQIYVGFILDGILAFQNFTIIYVFHNPKNFHFLGNDRIAVFKVYKGQETVEIWGGNLSMGASREDYDIIVGEDGNCEIPEDPGDWLIFNKVTCKPPKERPPLGDVHKNGKPGVTAKVGRSPIHHVGYIKYEVKPWDDKQIRTAVIATLCVAVVIIVVVPTAVIFARRKQNRRRRHGGNSNVYSEPQGLLRHVPPELMTDLESCMKDASRFTVGKQLGEGQFGSVHVGKFLDDNNHSIPVAAKTIKESGVSRQEFREFLEEALMMKDFHHENVLNLVCVVFKAGRPFVLLPYMANGDLKSHLKNENKTFTVENLLVFGQQAAQGMAYLEASRCVHRDLAARNCMVSAEEVVKIADFGLARDIFQEEYYRVGDMSRPLPIKWMAPECMEDYKFTSKSDVWSYGVLLWEILTRGKRPYAHIDNMQLKSYIMMGNRLEKPSYLPDTVYDIMLKCWKADPGERPSFNDIVGMLAILLQSDDDVSDEGDDNDTAVALTPEAEDVNDPASHNRYQNLSSRYVEGPDEIHGYERMSQSFLGPDADKKYDYMNIAVTIDVRMDMAHVEEKGEHNQGSRPLSGYLKPSGAISQEFSNAVFNQVEQNL